jgi:hypothetical protein
MSIDEYGNHHAVPGAPGAGRFVEKANVKPAEGLVAKSAPLPQQPGELLTWLVEGDDHEFVAVISTSAEDAIAEAASVFSERYDEPYSEDLLEVVAGFRGDSGSTDEMEWVPGTGADENEAFSALEDADL